MQPAVPFPTKLKNIAWLGFSHVFTGFVSLAPCSWEPFHWKITLYFPAVTGTVLPFQFMENWYMDSLAGYQSKTWEWLARMKERRYWHSRSVMENLWHTRCFELQL